MVGRSLKASEAGIEIAEIALTSKGWTREFLFEKVELCHATGTNFFIRIPIYRTNFVKICKALELDWQEIAQLEQQEENSTNSESTVQQVRHSCYEKIQHECGSLRMLDISRPIALNDIFTEVNVLEQITSQQRRDISQLAKDFNPELNNFDRLGLGKILQARVSGLDAVSQFQKLMVLGKPGSGKTTFLQHIAIQCNEGEFEPKRVPIFIKLKEFAEDASNRGELNLLDYLCQELNICKIAPETTKNLLSEGKALILLDGLDEVAEEDSNKVVREIRKLTHNYYKNYFVITCRIAASKYQFQGFTDVEVADFNFKQVESFAQKWFVAEARNNQLEGKALATQFIDKLLRPENKAIRELAVTPILLNLTCLVFQANADFPANRSRLYEQGLDILLRKWDESKGICREHPLNLARKKQLLSQLAYITFENGEYFFEQSQLQQLIADYFQILPDATTDPDELQLYSKAVLKSIVMRHGLLVERAQEIYSFSHLTFQEYLTAKYIVDNYTLHSLEKLVNHITEERWREVFFLSVGMLPSADLLLLLMKHQIDRLLAADEKLQKFLEWVSQKSASVEIPYKPAAVRSRYFVLDPSLLRALIPAIDRAVDPTLDRALIFALDPGFAHAIDSAIEYAIERVFDLTLINLLDRAIVNALDCTQELVLNLALDLAFEADLKSELRQALQELKEQLPSLDSGEEVFQQWWRTNGKAWTKQLREIMILHRNIGHDWQFNYHQRRLLQQYYNANLLLVDCLNSAYSVIPGVREEIEETLLLPFAEIEQKLNNQGSKNGITKLSQ